MTDITDELKLAEEYMKYSDSMTEYGMNAGFRNISESSYKIATIYCLKAIYEQNKAIITRLDAHR